MRRAIPTILLLLLALNTGWFVVYSAHLGWQGITADNSALVSRVFALSGPLGTFAIAVHMGAGALLTIAAPLQALPPLRRHWPKVHRCAGYVIFLLALITSAGGLVYITLHGTVGGWWMSLWFAIYGGAIGLAAWRTVHYAQLRDVNRHFAWATRLVILAVGSWIYRMHYALWYATTGGIGSRPDFSGFFDQVQVVAFYVPYLLIAEVLLRRSSGRARRAKPAKHGKSWG